MELFVKLNKESNITIILVTHEKEIADFSRRLIFFRDGVVSAMNHQGRYD